MEASCACEAITVKEEWLEDVGYKRTDEVGGSERVNQAFIDAVAALDHNYCMRKVTFKDEPQEYQYNDDDFIEEVYGDVRIGEGETAILPEDHWSKATLTAEEDVEEIDDGWSDSAHTFFGEEMRKNEQSHVPAKEGAEKTDDPWSNVAHEPDGHFSVNGMVIKENHRDYEHTNDDMMMDRLCTIQAESGDPPSKLTDNEDTLSSDETAVEMERFRNKVTEDVDWSYSWPDEIIGDEGDSLSADEVTGENDNAADSDELWTPSKRVHSRKQADRFVCHSCGLKCNKRSILKIHRTSSATCNKPYACNLCDKRYKRNRSLKEHLLKHTGIKPYSCEMCSFATTSASYLKCHLRIHTGEKPYDCPMCDRAFRRLSDLNCHLKKNHTP